MATLTRTKISPPKVSEPPIASSVPAPFPILQREHILREEAEQPVIVIAQRPRSAEDRSEEQREPTNEAQHELLPSIALVQKSCLMTLNNLLSVPTKWSPIVPDRRHSMPSPHDPAPSTQFDTLQSSSALYTLVSNLRNREAVMIESRPSHSDTDLIKELRTRVESLSSTLDPTDVQLARALVSLIAHFDRLSVIQATSSSRDTVASFTSLIPLEPTAGQSDVFTTLKRQLNDLRSERLSHPGSIDQGSPALVVEKALLWSQIDEELDNVVHMCKERTDGLPPFSTHSLPPEYDRFHDEYDSLPAYHSEARSSIDSQNSKNQVILGTKNGLDEKMRRDLESVSMAIDRLYLVAPQLQNQRVELKTSKLQQMERARQAGNHSTSRLQKSALEGKTNDDTKELDGILDLLSKATERKLVGQSVVLEGDLKVRLEKSRLRALEKREAFVEQLLDHSGAGRLHSQDAVLSPIPRSKAPDALLSLPEFLRQAVPDSIRLADPNALLTLPEFFKEPIPDHIIQSSTVNRLKSKKSRHRSSSAPPISWLRPSLSRSQSVSIVPSSSPAAMETVRVTFDVQYIAENHENLHHIIVFITVTGAVPDAEPEAEVLPSVPDVNEGDRLFFRIGPNTSPPLLLPAPTFPGKKPVKAHGGHYEIKLSTSPFTPVSASETLPLLDASQLTSMNTTNFACASCSLPLVRSHTVETYRDLPSEHWAELVDAWMCHADQRLHDQVAKHSRGFWPEKGQALVGGSYILFDESSIVTNNLWRSEQSKRDEDWRCVRCICGAILGRCQEHRSDDGAESTIYRLVKYAIRPMSTLETLKIPLSAFIVEDMTEFVQAHATYRFVLFDEEEERPRILIWLFKPNIKIAYSVPVQYAIAKSGSFNAAKVLYKIVGPWAAPEQLKSILNKYPGFPQAEYLYYPLDICRRVGRLLKESNSTYPQNMRTMTGLEVGWLQRA